MSPSNRPLLSIVAPVHDEERNLRELYGQVKAAVEPLSSDFELIYVDDGSTDASASTIEALASEDPRVKLVEFSRNFGKECAILAGYDHSRGRAVVVLDADLQTPPSVIPKMVEKWHAGAEIVNGIRESTAGQSWTRRTASRLFYWIMRRLSDTEIVPNSVDFRLLDRRVVDEIRNCRERFRFNRGLATWVGFRHDHVTFVAPERGTGQSQWSFRKLAAYALDAIFSFSAVPLRVTGFIGLVVSLLGLIYLLVNVVAHIVVGQPPGYASIVGGVFLLGGVQLLGIWVLGEYIARLYEEIKGRPLYIVRRLIDNQDAQDRPAHV